MKFLKALPVLGLALSSVSAESPVFQFAANQCGEGMVPNFYTRVCIQPNYIEGCMSYASQSQCQACAEDYIKNGHRCDLSAQATANSHIPGCLVSDVQGSCVNCANGFRRINGGCTPGIKNCFKYDDAGNCSTCKSDFSLVLGDCRHNLLLGCKIETLDHTCQECFSPFKLDGSQCRIDNCKTFNDFGCTSCQCAFYLTPQRNCKEVAKGCLRYQRGTCINCLKHYRLKGGICEIDGCIEYDGNFCNKCSSHYEKTQDGGCAFKNCYDWLDNACLVCADGFRKEGDVCVKLTADSLQCS